MQEYFTLLSLFIIHHSVPGTNGQTPCPDPNEILPCTCSHDASLGTVIVDCSGAISSDDIYTAFNDATWPFPKLTGFRMVNNEGVRVLPAGAFGDITFEEIYIHHTSLGSIHTEALLPSKDRLGTLEVSDSLLEDFPWESLPELTGLKNLYLHGNSFTSLPPLVSASLEDFRIFTNEIAQLEVGWSLPNLTILDLGFNLISEFPAGFLNDSENFQQFFCYYCSFGPTLSANSLEFHSATIQFIELEGNSISTLEADAITGFQSDTVINFDFNDIRELTEESFRPMLEVLSQGDGHIFLIGNPVVCDCSMAWVVLNPDFLVDVQGHCTDGTDFQDLDPSIFQDFCIRRDPPTAGEYSTWINSGIPTINGP